MQDQKIRLQKMLADCGVASRRKAEELIQQGKVKVNGHVAQIGDKVNPKTDHVTVAGRRIVASRQYYYIMLHKPRGYVSTMSDEMGRKCVAELVKDIPARVYPVGRLDRDSEGLLLMTNDGEFANLIMHPSKHVPKTYRVTVRPDISEEQLALMNVGMEIDGVRTAGGRLGHQPGAGQSGFGDHSEGGTKPADPEDVRAAWSGGSQIEARCGRTG